MVHGTRGEEINAKNGPANTRNWEKQQNGSQSPGSSGFRTSGTVGKYIPFFSSHLTFSNLSWAQEAYKCHCEKVVPGEQNPKLSKKP